MINAINKDSKDMGLEILTLPFKFPVWPVEKTDGF